MQATLNKLESAVQTRPLTTVSAVFGGGVLVGAAAARLPTSFFLLPLAKLAARAGKRYATDRLFNDSEAN